MNHASWTIMKILKYKGQRGKKKNQTSKAKIKILKFKQLKLKKKKKKSNFKGQTFSLVYNFTEDLSRKQVTGIN